MRLTLTLLHLHHSSFSNHSTALPTSQLIPQPFCCFTNITGTPPTSQLILQSFCRFTHITAHSTALLLLHLRHSSFSNPSAASSMPQLILKPFRCFTYVTGHSTTLLLLYLRHKHFMPMHRGLKKQCSLLQQVTQFRSSYSFGQLLRILLRAVNLFSFNHIVCSDSSFNIHNALYFVKYPSRAAQNSSEGRRRPAG